MELVHNDTKGQFKDRFKAREGYVHARFMGSSPDVIEGLKWLRLSYGLICL